MWQLILELVGDVYAYGSLHKHLLNDMRTTLSQRFEGVQSKTRKQRRKDPVIEQYVTCDAAYIKF